MNSSKYLGIILMFCVVLPLRGQQSGECVVCGSLKDSVSLHPVPYATVRVKDTGNRGMPEKLTVTDTNGYFKIGLFPVGKYVVTFSCVGYQSVDREFVVKTGQDRVDLGVSRIKTGSETLERVDVIARRLPIKFDLDKITYDVEADPEAGVQNMLDLLRKVPLVTVGGDDEIELNGQSCRVYINGRPSGLMKFKPGKSLKGIPATAVRKVEVITNPGAKYDASGVGGIINIEMARGRLDGYSLFMREGGNADGGWYLGMSGMLKYNKFSVSAFGSYNDVVIQEGVYNAVLENLNGREEHHLLLSVRNEGRQPMSWGNLDMSYEIDSLNLLTFSVVSNRSRVEREQDERDEMQREDNSPLYRYRVIEKNETERGGTEVSFNYQRTFERPDDMFTLSYLYNHMPSNGYTRRDMVDCWKENEQVRFSSYDVRNRNRAYTDEHTFQADYVKHFEELHALECGLKYICRNTSSKSFYKSRIDSNESWDSLTSRVENFSHVQDIYAAYVAYALKYDKFGMKAGCRFERENLDVALHSGEEPDFDSHFSNFIPSVVFSLQPASNRTWKLDYNMRIMRPGVWSLNPYRIESEANTVTYGNSHLDAERFHQIDFGFSSFTPKWMLNASIGYRYSGNSIQTYSFMNGSRKEVTCGNIGKENSVALNLFMNYNLNDKTSFRLTGNAEHLDITSDETRMKARGWQYSIDGIIQRMLWFGIRGSVYVGYKGAPVRLYGSSSGYHYYIFMLDKSFFKNRFTFSFTANNFADGHRKVKGKNTGTGFVQHFENNMIFSSYQLVLSYRIGNLWDAVKKVKRGIVRDDGGQESTQPK